MTIIVANTVFGDIAAIARRREMLRERCDKAEAAVDQFLGAPESHPRLPLAEHTEHMNRLIKKLGEARHDLSGNSDEAAVYQAALDRLHSNRVPGA